MNKKEYLEEEPEDIIRDLMESEDLLDEEPWYEPEDCNRCSKLAEDNDVEYEANFKWNGYAWICDTCGKIC